MDIGPKTSLKEVAESLSPHLSHETQDVQKYYHLYYNYDDVQGRSQDFREGGADINNANFGHTHLQNGKVEVQVITKNTF